MWGECGAASSSTATVLMPSGTTTVSLSRRRESLCSNANSGSRDSHHHYPTTHHGSGHRRTSVGSGGNPHGTFQYQFNNHRRDSAGHPMMAFANYGGYDGLTAAAAACRPPGSMSHIAFHFDGEHRLQPRDCGPPILDPTTVTVMSEDVTTLENNVSRPPAVVTETSVNPDESPTHSHVHHHHRNHPQISTWSYIYQKVWGTLRGAFKKGQFDDDLNHQRRVVSFKYNFWS